MPALNGENFREAARKFVQTLYGRREQRSECANDPMRSRSTQVGGEFIYLNRSNTRPTAAQIKLASTNLGAQSEWVSLFTCTSCGLLEAQIGRLQLV